MLLNQILNEFTFNLETISLLRNLGWSQTDIENEIKSLGFSDGLLHFHTNSIKLFNSVMLRLRIYSEQNLDENTVRNSFNKLNNPNVLYLLDHLYSDSNLGQVQLSSNTSVTNMEENNDSNNLSNEVVNEVTDDVADEVSNDDTEENPYESFFNSCVEQTDDPTDIVKSGDFYNAFSEWWASQYNDNIPDKKNLRIF